MNASILRIVALAVVALADAAHGVSLSAEGKGQALLFPYYTVRAVEGNAFNTYVSIVNHSSTDKVLRVRFREALEGSETASFNLFLARNATWTGVIFPAAQGTQLSTADTNCTDPPLGPEYSGAAGSPVITPAKPLSFRSATTSSDAVGLERTRAGMIEVLEMGSTATPPAGLQYLNQYPADCAAVRNQLAAYGPPTGGLSGAYTLINVANGQEFTGLAEALADVASRAYVRAAADPYPAFTSSEIDPVSIIHANGAIYRSTWATGLDAVNAVLMRSAIAEFSIDPAIAARTDYVVSFPTRGFAMTDPAAPKAPFLGGVLQGTSCRGAFKDDFYTIEVDFRSQSWTVVNDIPGFDNAFRSTALCGSANVLTHAFNSKPIFGGTAVAGGGNFFVPLSRDGVSTISFGGTLTSLASSARIDIATGAKTTGAHTIRGLPLVGFAARTFTNGYLNCSGQTCQGNYASAQPYRFRRNVSP